MGAMKESSRAEEKRRVPRIPVDFPVTITWGRKQYRWQARELSEYGILVASPKVASPSQELVGEDVQLALSLNLKDPPFSLLGVAVYSTDAGVGIRFKNVSPENQVTLRAYAQVHGIGISRPQTSPG